MVSMGWLVTGGLVAARLSGAMMVMPAIGIQGVPGLVRVLCALALTGVVAPIVPQNTELLTVTQLVGGMSAEVILGIVLGGALRLIFGALALAKPPALVFNFDDVATLRRGSLTALSTTTAQRFSEGMDGGGPCAFSVGRFWRSNYDFAPASGHFVCPTDPLNLTCSCSC